MFAARRAGKREGAVIIAVLAAVFIGFVLLLGIVSPARAIEVMTVETTTDAPDATPGDGKCEATESGKCTLRAAVMEAEAGAGGEIVVPEGSYKLTIPGGTEANPIFLADQPDAAKGDLDISKRVTIRGAGVAKTVIDGLDAVRIFDIHNGGGDLSLQAIRLSNGLGDWDSKSQHYHGGALHNHGTMNLSHVVVDSSTSPPVGSTPSPWGGGGITNAASGVAVLNEVTIARNSSEAWGGGIENHGNLKMTHVTVAENTAPDGQGGGIYNTGHVQPADTIFAENTGRDCTPSSFIASLGHNLDGDGSCRFNQPTDQRGPAAFEAGLPGAPLYYRPSSSSFAVDNGSAENCTGTDIRGMSRPQDSEGDKVAECEIGSYEREPFPLSGGAAMLRLDDEKATEAASGAQTMRFDVKLSEPVQDDVTVRAATADGTAKAGSDYKAKRSTLRFAEGQQTKRFAVKVLADRRDERKETFKVKLTQANGAKIADGKATGTIANR